jgi:hypothetical protein
MLRNCKLLAEYSPDSLSNMPRIRLIRLGTCFEICLNYDVLTKNALKAAECFTDLYRHRIDRHLPVSALAGPSHGQSSVPEMRGNYVPHNYGYSNNDVSNWDILCIFSSNTLNSAQNCKCNSVSSSLEGLMISNIPVRRVNVNQPRRIGLLNVYFQSFED